MIAENERFEAEAETRSERILAIYEAHRQDVIKFMDSMTAMLMALKQETRFLPEDFCQVSSEAVKAKPDMTFKLEQFAYFVNPLHDIKRAVEEFNMLWTRARDTHFCMAWLIEHGANTEQKREQL